MSNARQAHLLCQYNGSNIGWPSQPGQQNIISSFTYESENNGKTDSIDLDVINRDRRWVNGWTPVKGKDEIVCNIFLTDWDYPGQTSNTPLGTYTVDQFEATFGSGGGTAKISAQSVPSNLAFRTAKRSKCWEDVTISQIANEIGSKYGLPIFFDGDDVTIKKIEQSQQADCDFIYKVANEYGFYVKTYSNRIVIYDIDKYEEKDVITTLHPNDVTSLTYNGIIGSGYGGCRLTYTDPDGNDTEILVGSAKSHLDESASFASAKASKSQQKQQTIAVTSGSGGTSVGSGQSSASGGGYTGVNVEDESRILTLNQTVNTREEGERIAQSKLNEANRGNETISVTMAINPRMIVGCNIDVKDFGAAVDGKYSIKTVRHTLGNSSTTELSCYKIQQKYDIVHAEPELKGSSWTVQQGDTLEQLARKFYDDRSLWKQIYAANSGVIEEVAVKHHFSSSREGHWIFPGTELVIPAKQ